MPVGERTRHTLRVETPHLNKRELRALAEQEREFMRAFDSETTEKVEELRFGKRNYPGLNEFWTGIPVRQPEHVATGFVLSSTYPFMAANPMRPMGPAIGIELLSGRTLFHFDPWEWYLAEETGAPDILIMGAKRRGKSFWVKQWLLRSILFGRQFINVSDSKGEHGRVALAVGGDVIRLGDMGSTNRINPLDAPRTNANYQPEGHDQLVAQRRSAALASIVATLLPSGEGLSPAEYSAMEWALERDIVETSNRPTLSGVFEQLSHADTAGTAGFNGLVDAAARPMHSLRRVVKGDLAGMFETHTTVQLRRESPYTVFDTEAMAARGDTALALSQIVTNSWVTATISDKTSKRTYGLIREEGWRDMNSQAALEAHRLQLKLGGEYGIAMVMIVHEGGDFDAVGPEGSVERDLARNVMRGYANVISFRQPPQALHESARVMNFTKEQTGIISELARGQYLLRTGSRFFVVDSRPTATQREIDLFDTDSASRRAATEEEV